MIVQISITNKLGTFSTEIEIEDTQYEALLQESKQFYVNGYNMLTDNNEHIFLGPDILKESILIIKKHND